MARNGLAAGLHKNFHLLGRPSPGGAATLLTTENRILEVCSGIWNAENRLRRFHQLFQANASESETLEQALRASRPGIRIFVDRKEIDVGSAWQPEIFETLDRCRKVVAMLSPDYLGSKVCKEEFNIAWIRGRETDEDVIFPVYLYTTPALPTYMKYRNYLDCREGDRLKIAEASKKLLATLDRAYLTRP